MLPHVFSQRPKYCVAFKPSMILVRLPSGEIHTEYFGPPDGDAAAAERELLRRELDAAVLIIARRNTAQLRVKPSEAA